MLEMCVMGGGIVAKFLFFSFLHYGFLCLLAWYYTKHSIIPHKA